MTSTAIVARGTTIAYYDTTTSPNAYVNIPNISSVSGPSSTTGEIEVTDLYSTAKEYLLDLVDNGTVSLTGRFDPSDATQGVLETANAAGTALTFRISFPQVSPTVTYTFTARVSEFSRDATAGDASNLTVGLRVTGAVVKA